MKNIPIPLTLIDEIRKNKIRQYLGKLIFKKGETYLNCYMLLYIIRHIFQY